MWSGLPRRNEAASVQTPTPGRVCVRALRNLGSYPSNCFSRHRTLHHTHLGPPAIKVEVLHRSLITALERRLLEVFGIRRLNPEINRGRGGGQTDDLRLIVW